VKSDQPINNLKTEITFEKYFILIK